MRKPIKPRANGAAHKFDRRGSGRPRPEGPREAPMEAPAIAVSAAPSAPPTRAQLLERVTNTIEQAAPAIVEAVVSQARSGNYLPAKFLFDFAGFVPTPTAPSATADQSLAALLLRSLGIGVQDDDVQRADVQHQDAVSPAASAGQVERSSTAGSAVSAANGDTARIAPAPPR
jgi:hypothetical protein